MIIYVKDKTAERLRELAGREKRRVSEQLEMLLDAYEKKVKRGEHANAKN